MKIIWVSNGHGEDRIACTLIEAWKTKAPEDEHQAVALVGAGTAYTLQKVLLLGSSFSPPSAGFAYLHPLLVAKDIQAGLLPHLYKQLKSLKNSHADLYIAVGDIVPLLALSLSKKASQGIFVACALSDYYTHGKSCFDPLQIYLLKKHHILTFARDQLTADNLNKRGVKACFMGNPMIDGIQNVKRQRSQREFALNKATLTLLLLPGSHHDAVRNLRYMTHLLAQSMPLLRFNCHFICVAAPDIEAELKTLQTELSLVFIPATDFGFAMEQAHGVIGLAGTANEQCVARGLPVISFSGPQGTQQYTEAFGEAQQRLLGAALRFYAHITPDILAWQLRHFNRHLASYTALATAVAKERFGAPGAHLRMVAHIRASKL